MHVLVQSFTISTNVEKSWLCVEVSNMFAPCEQDSAVLADDQTVLPGHLLLYACFRFQMYCIEDIEKATARKRDRTKHGQICTGRNRLATKRVGCDFVNSGYKAQSGFGPGSQSCHRTADFREIRSQP